MTPPPQPRTTAVPTADEIINAYCCVFPDGTMFWCDAFDDAIKAVEVWEGTESARSLPEGTLGGFVEVRMPRSKYDAIPTSNTGLLS